MIYLRYLWYVLKHKWFVFQECVRPHTYELTWSMFWRAITHDLSKFRPDEFIPYARFFYGGPYSPKQEIENAVSGWLGNPIPKEEIQAAFDIAWLKHIHRNPHHWQYWLLTEDDPDTKWTVQAFQPEFGPWYLARNNQQVAILDDEILTGDPVLMNPASSLIAEEIKDHLNKHYRIIPMHYGYLKEMLADWRGAGRAITGSDDVRAWYEKHKKNIVLDDNSRQWIEDHI